MEADDAYGMTPLHWAVWGTAEVVTALWRLARTQMRETQPARHRYMLRWSGVRPKS